MKHRYVFVASLLTASTSCIAGSAEAAFAETLRVVAEGRPLTDPVTVFQTLVIAPKFHVVILKDHVRVLLSSESLKGTPYQSVSLVPFAKTPSIDHPDYSSLSLTIAQEAMCLTKEDVIRAFGNGYKTAPIIATDGGGGTHVIYQLQRTGEQIRSVYFSFDRPEKCASSVSVSARF